MTSRKEIEKNASTEEKIKEAAKLVFTKKGFAATRTRDIAEESGYNLALINYYFRSKQQLFDIIMLEHIQSFIMSITPILNDRKTTLHEKIQLLVNHYIDMLIKNPDIPIFILSEIAADPRKLISSAGVDNLGGNVFIVEQFQEMVRQKKITIDPLHMVVNVVSLTIFPFISRPLLCAKTGMSQEAFNALMEERKKLIPVWVDRIIG